MIIDWEGLEYTMAYVLILGTLIGLGYSIASGGLLGQVAGWICVGLFVLWVGLLTTDWIMNKWLAYRYFRNVDNMYEILVEAKKIVDKKHGR